MHESVVALLRVLTFNIDSVNFEMFYLRGALQYFLKLMLFYFV